MTPTRNVAKLCISQNRTILGLKHVDRNVLLLYSRQTRSSSSAGAESERSTRIEAPDVKRLAKLAQIKVSDEEAADWEPKLAEIANWFDQLQKIDVEGVPPCPRSSLTNLLAAGRDEPHEFADREALLRGIPDREGPYIKVPKIL